MTMDVVYKLTHGNRTFFKYTIGTAMCSGPFADAVLRSLEVKSYLFMLEKEKCPGRITIDSTSLKEGSVRDDFSTAVSGGILSDVAKVVYKVVTGPSNTRATVACEGYRFIFALMKYERDKKHKFKGVTDPTRLPAGEKFGRVVRLKIVPLLVA